ncbi:MAG: type II secretion system F family protein, partial [Acidimicrobiia bacterium]
LSVGRTVNVPGYATTTTRPPPTATTLAQAQPSLVQGDLPASPATLRLLGTAATGLTIVLFISIVFTGNREEPGSALVNRLQAYGRRGGRQAEEGRGLLDRLPILRRFTGRAEEELRQRGLLSSVNAALEQGNVPLSPGEAIAAGVGLSIVIGGLGALFTQSWVGGIVAFAVMLLLLAAVVQWAGSREKRRFEDQLPDTLTLISTSLRAGYSLLQAVEAVAAESPNPTSREFGRAIAESRLGRPVVEALHGITNRMQSEDFAWAVMAVEIQREVGGNLAEVLQTVADTMLARNRLRGEIRALTAEGRISAFVLGVLPFAMALFLVTSNPEYLEPLYTTTGGLLAIGVGLILMIAGALWLKKIVDIEV